MATRTRGGTEQFLGRRVVKFYTNGRRADNAYGLSERVGQIVKRTDAARMKAVVSTSRRASPMATNLITSRYTIPRSEVSGRVKVYDTGDTLHVNASVRKFPLGIFAASWAGPTSDGATVSVHAGQMTTYAGAFMAPGRYRGRVIDLVYMRQRGRKVIQKYGRYAGKMRESIRSLLGPSTYDMLLSIERETSAGKSGAGELTRALRSFYVSELRRLYAVEAGKNG